MADYFGGGDAAAPAENGAAATTGAAQPAANGDAMQDDEILVSNEPEQRVALKANKIRSEQLNLKGTQGGMVGNKIDR